MWKIGDRAIIDHPPCDHHGKEITIISIGEEGRTKGGAPFLGAGVDIAKPNWPSGHYVLRYSLLRPIPDDSKSTWSELEKTLKWNPTKLVTVEIEQ